MPLPPDDPRHGTRQGGFAEYKLGEKPCARCAPAIYRYEKHARHLRTNGTRQLVPLGEEAHAYLQRAPRLQVAAASGVSPHHLDRLRKGGPTKITRMSTRDAILAAARSTRYVTPVGLHRRVRALAAIGWSARELQNQSGIWASTWAKIRTRPPKEVKSVIVDAIAALYDELCMQVPPPGKGADRTRYWAQRNGYLPPLAWDDIDDPGEHPNRSAVAA